MQAYVEKRFLPLLQSVGMGPGFENHVLDYWRRATDWVKPITGVGVNPLLKVKLSKLPELLREANKIPDLQVRKRVRAAVLAKCDIIVDPKTVLACSAYPDLAAAYKYDLQIARLDVGTKVIYSEDNTTWSCMSELNGGAVQVWWRHDQENALTAAKESASGPAYHSNLFPTRIIRLNTRPFKRMDAANNLCCSESHANRKAIQFSNCGHGIIFLRKILSHSGPLLRRISYGF